MRLRVPHNAVGALGLALFAGSIVSFAFLLLVEIGQAHASPYRGLFHYLVLPTVGTLGLILLGLGALRERRARRAAADLAAGPRRAHVERQQAALLGTGVLAGVLVFLMSLGGVRAIEYTESEAFCGQVCHQVMEPEYTAWQASPHAQIACVDCHAGEGLGSFVQAKARGIRQVAAVLTDNFERPIPTPIHGDWAETRCAGCHWPARDLGEKPIRREYHLTEGFDEPWTLEMTLKVGGGDRDTGFTDGAHWHMQLENRIAYRAIDPQAREIAAARFEAPDGSVIEYANRDLDPDAPPAPPGEWKDVTCVTCHSRPAHRFNSPVQELNHAFRTHVIDPGVPGVRWLGPELLAAEYATSEEGLAAIDSTLRRGVTEEDPDWAAANRASLDATVAALQRIFERTRFPEMRVRWDTYPDHSQHWSNPGCFRCHAGNMVSADGRSVSSSCDTCHLVTAQGRVEGEWQQDPRGLAFLHPPDLEPMEAPILCHECHDGALGY